MRYPVEEERDQGVWPGWDQLQGQRVLQERFEGHEFVYDIVGRFKLLILGEFEVFVI